MESYDFSALDRQTSNAGITVSMLELAEALFSGDWSGMLGLLGEILQGSLFFELEQGREWMLELIAIAVAGSLLGRFMEMVTTDKMSKTADYVLNLLFITLLFTCFHSAVSLAQGCLVKITEFTKALVPAYCTALAVTGKIGAATVSGQCLLMSVTVVEWLSISVIIPVIECYLVLHFLEQLIGEELFGNLRELLEQGVNWALKAVLGVLLGVQLVQTTVLPSADAGGYQLGSRLVSLIPGIGGTAQTVIQTAVGSAVLVKNCIGGAGMILLGCLTAIPCLKLTFLAVGYQLTAAVIQPACEKSMAAMAAGTASAVGMLAKTVAMGGFLFFLSIAAISSATSMFVG